MTLYVLLLPCLDALGGYYTHKRVRRWMGEAVCSDPIGLRQRQYQTLCFQFLHRQGISILIVSSQLSREAMEHRKDSIGLLRKTVGNTE
ncbi:hypothetical protein F5Y06DRAFT_43737 [Hypoxylon sp. FL0890]|nr:hypothetical protein F5Y06DRAFT_43737 [Hypoxylon sp. FL0890]